MALTIVQRARIQEKREKKLRAMAKEVKIKPVIDLTSEDIAPAQSPLEPVTMPEPAKPPSLLTSPDTVKPSDPPKPPSHAPIWAGTQMLDDAVEAFSDSSEVIY